MPDVWALCSQGDNDHKFLGVKFQDAAFDEVG